MLYNLFDKIKYIGKDIDHNFISVKLFFNFKLLSLSVLHISFKRPHALINCSLSKTPYPINHNASEWNFYD